MRNFNATELAAIVGLGNRIDLERHELSVRYDEVSGAYLRVLHLSDEPALRVEVSLTPKSDVLCDRPWVEYWREVKTGVIRLGPSQLARHDRQYRNVRTASALYQRMEEPMREYLSMKDIGFLTHRAFLDEIDWVKFLQAADLHPDQSLSCSFAECRRPVANLQAMISRQVADTSPYRQRLSDRVRVG